MNPTICSRCKKNVAVVFITKLENGKTENEGLCLKCAKELGINAKTESDLTRRLSETIDSLYEKTEQMVNDLKQIPADNLEATNYCADVLVNGMKEMRKDADLLEKLTDKSYWPYPIYSDILYY